MEKEIIKFKKTNPPIRVSTLNMCENKLYRDIHSHTAIEIVQVKNGILNCQINNKLLTVNQKQILFINSNVHHKLFSENAKIVYINIDLNYFKEDNSIDEFSLLYDFILCFKSNPYMLISDNAEIFNTLQQINNEYYKTTEESKWYLKSYIYRLIGFMYSKSFICPITNSSLKIEKIKHIIRYINNNYKSNITLDSICQAAKYNKFAVCHTFKSITGATIFEYINFLRIQYAIGKLKQNNITILEISTECGFSSIAYFDKVFKKIIGCPPSVYRKQVFDV